MTADQLIANYVHDLRVSAWIRQLPPAQTADLEKEVRATIAAQLAAAGKRDEATIYGVLDRLGPAGEIVARHSDAPPSDRRRTINNALAPVARGRAILRARGWGAAEIGSLLLLILGPFYLWWIGPIFGIILVRMAAGRWSHRSTHIATLVVVWLFAAQTVMAVGLLAIAMSQGLPGSLGGICQRSGRVASLDLACLHRQSPPAEVRFP